MNVQCMIKFNMFQDRSLFCLQKWKRTHLRARLDDLRESLKEIGRLDILNELNKQLTAFDNLVVKKDEYNGISKQKLKEKKILTKEEEEIERKKVQAEILHEKLEDFFERRKIVRQPKVYKFHSSYIK